jgi:hypothetical protein
MATMAIRRPGWRVLLATVAVAVAAAAGTAAVYVSAAATHAVADNGVINAHDNGVISSNVLADNGVINADANGVINSDANGVINSNDDGVENSNIYRRSQRPAASFQISGSWPRFVDLPPRGPASSVTKASSRLRAGGGFWRASAGDRSGTVPDE